MRTYRYKADSNIDAYGYTDNVIHAKFGDLRKHYHFTDEFRTSHPRFCAEYDKYFDDEPSLFSDPLSIINYIDTFHLPVRIYSNYVDEEFADLDAVREWLAKEYSGQHSRELSSWGEAGRVGLDGEHE